MQAVSQTLDEARSLYQQVVGMPPPELRSEVLVPFPPGVDPIEHVTQEVKQLQQLSRQVAYAPQPGTWTPAADCLAGPQEFLIRLDATGVTREDLKVFVVGGECVVRGERKPLDPKSELRPLAMERPIGSFERRFVLPVGSKVKNIQARQHEGILEVRIPLEDLSPKDTHKIEVV